MLGSGAARAREAPPEPDFRGWLRPNLPIEAYFDAGRERGFLRVRAHVSRLYRAWKVALADLDGDGTREVLLGIWSRKHRHEEREPHRTVWVIQWDDERSELVTAWRGSALARPLVDFRVIQDRLVATERLGQRCYETPYEWTGFGFTSRESRAIPCKDP